MYGLFMGFRAHSWRSVNHSPTSAPIARAASIPRWAGRSSPQEGPSRDPTEWDPPSRLPGSLCPSGARHRHKGCRAAAGRSLEALASWPSWGLTRTTLARAAPDLRLGERGPRSPAVVSPTEPAPRAEDSVGECPARHRLALGRGRTPVAPAGSPPPRLVRLCISKLRLLPASSGQCPTSR